MRRSYKKKNSTRVLSLALLVVVAILTVFYFLNKNENIPSASKQDENAVIAEVGETKIYRSDILDKFKEIFAFQSSSEPQVKIEEMSSETVEVLAKEIYMEKELLKRAKSKNIEKDPQVIEAINKAKDSIIRRAYVDSVVKEQVTDEAVRNKYIEVSKQLEGKKEYLTYHILVKTKAEADKIVKTLSTASKAAKKGTEDKFSEVAKKYSLDKESASNGGKLGYMLESGVIKEMSEILSTLKIDEISKPIQSKFGWHIVKVAEVRDAKPLSFDAIKDNLKEQIIREEFVKINSEIMANAKVKVLLNKEKPAEASEVKDEVKEDVNKASEASEATKSEEVSGEIKPSEESAPAAEGTVTIEENKDSQQIDQE